MLILNDTNYGTVLGASGVQGMYGEGYWFHDVPLIRPNFEGMTFVAKTMTAMGVTGNMPYDWKTMRPTELFPKCIVANIRKRVMLNAVGLSNPGCADLIGRGIWQQRTDAHMLSFMANDRESVLNRLDQTRYFCTMLGLNLHAWRSPIALQVNFSCPNVGINPMHLLGEIGDSLKILSSLGIPLIPKINALVPPEVAVAIARDVNCAAICVSNTIPWKQLDPEWKVHFFGSETSPLEHLGGGGFSGYPLFSMVARWLAAAMDLRISKPVIAGGGIFSVDDARTLLDFGAAAISIGSVASLRPRNVQSIIRSAIEYDR